ncbi:pre-mRNA processing factor 3-domain-containing protein [Radiomyces spectabilis]|uniref:pre-mRNA processing factor 3-domain-containing protein n=1 Tax=Radiomyces spectabilis TaxID=64574 RepID=UPI00221F5878|nr:pre-mRNA processing factor 3-domain-containing protein [Radiomyces spectabilis]KAI8376537.1 pre-mRNA processing factor 3-domain-containing protein [Radiomyces spectabilis]
MSASQWKPPPTPPKASPSPVPVLPPTGGLNASGKIDLVEIQRKIAEAKARVTASGASLPRSPVASMRTADKIPAAPPQIALDEAGNLDLKAMLDKGIIPKRETLTSKANERKAAAAAAAAKPNKEAKTLKIEQPPEDFTDTTKNPYYDPNLHAQAAPKLRRSRPLKFVQPGKFVQQANQERAKAQLEKLKQEIAESVRKAGMEVEMDVSDKAIKKEPPPAAEWWDAPFLPNKTYDDLETAPVNPDELGALVTLYVHHPIPIKPPTDNSAATPVRSLMLTKKERKKLRRQRRQEAQKEKQDRIRLGLLPPDPPKVKISNLMRVLGQEAIQDPTKIEAKVRKEMEMRQKQHELANAQRQLTPEERRAKIMNKLKEDQKTSNEVAVFK